MITYNRWFLALWRRLARCCDLGIDLNDMRLEEEELTADLGYGRD